MGSYLSRFAERNANRQRIPGFDAANSDQLLLLKHLVQQERTQLLSGLRDVAAKALHSAQSEGLTQDSANEKLELFQHATDLLVMLGDRQSSAMFLDNIEVESPVYRLDRELERFPCAVALIEMRSCSLDQVVRSLDNMEPEDISNRRLSLLAAVLRESLTDGRPESVDDLLAVVKRLGKHSRHPDSIARLEAELRKKSHDH